MARRNRNMTFEEWMEKEAELCEFDKGDSPKIYSKLGEKVLKEEIRKEVTCETFKIPFERNE